MELGLRIRCLRLRGSTCLDLFTLTTFLVSEIVRFEAASNEFKYPLTSIGLRELFDKVVLVRPCVSTFR